MSLSEYFSLVFSEFSTLATLCFVGVFGGLLFTVGGMILFTIRSGIEGREKDKKRELGRVESERALAQRAEQQRREEVIKMAGERKRAEIDRAVGDYKKDVRKLK